MRLGASLLAVGQECNLLLVASSAAAPQGRVLEAALGPDKVLPVQRLDFLVPRADVPVAARVEAAPGQVPQWVLGGNSIITSGDAGCPVYGLAVVSFILQI